MGQREAIGSTSARPSLRLVESGGAPEPTWAWFCGHCAARPASEAPPAPTARVCTSCGMGLLLETREDVLPEPGDAFLVLDSRMTVQAMSIGAERLLGTDEALAIDHPITELLVPAGIEDRGKLPDAIGAALRADEPLGAFVRPWNTFGVRIRAQITACGPPRAVLILLRSGEPGQA